LVFKDKKLLTRIDCPNTFINIDRAHFSMVETKLVITNKVFTKNDITFNERFTMKPNKMEIEKLGLEKDMDSQSNVDTNIEW